MSLSDISTSNDWFSLAPIMVILGVGAVGVLLEAFVPDSVRRSVQAWFTGAGLSAAAVITFILWGRTADDGAAVSFNGAVVVDQMAVFTQGLLLVLGVLSLVIIASRRRGDEDVFTPQAAAVPGSDYEEQARKAGLYQSEIYPLFLFALGGMMLFAVSSDFITLFVALEVLSLPLYVMAGMGRRRRLLSLEASFKYFVLGAFASALFIFGAALIYGATASVQFREVMLSLAGQAGDPGMDQLAVVGVLLIMSALLFKIGAVPFHNWTPDVYQGAPTPVTAFMAATVKVAAFVALIRVAGAVVLPLEWDLRPVMAVVAAITIIVGTVISITQSDVKRMLAYSSVAHAGFILLGIVGFSEAGIRGILIYLVAYALATLGAFAIVGLVRERQGAGTDKPGQVLGEASNLSQYAGLGKEHPLIATALAIFLLSFAGIPLTAGFLGKLGVFTAAIDEGWLWLVLIGAAASVAAAFVYVRLIVLMFFSPAEQTDQPAGVTVVGGKAAFWAIGVCAVGTIVIGTVPGPLLNIIEEAARFFL